MKKWMNSIFYGSCFIAAMLIEVYSIQILDGNLFVTAGVGIAVLITGYLLMDSLRGAINKNSEETRFYVDHLLNNEAEKWNERYTELVNLTKASYTAVKKNTAIGNEQYEAVLMRLEELESNHSKALQRITELQKKALEGQKNALNLEINYNKENMKQLIGIIREEDKNIELKDKVNKILELLEKNNELLEARLEQEAKKADRLAEYPVHSFYPEAAEADTDINIELPITNSFESGSAEENLTEEYLAEKSEIENAPDTELSFMDLPEPEADDFVETTDPTDTADPVDIFGSVDAFDQAEVAEPADAFDQIDAPASEEGNLKVAPLYDDPNKALTADEIAALFASIGK